MFLEYTMQDIDNVLNNVPAGDKESEYTTLWAVLEDCCHNKVEFKDTANGCTIEILSA